MSPSPATPSKLVATEVRLPTGATLPMAANHEQLAVNVCGASHAGLFRDENQDQFLIASLSGALWVQQSSVRQQRVQCSQPVGHLLAIADGIGGLAGGAQASAIAIESVERFALGALGWLFGLVPTSPQENEEGLLDELKLAFARAEREVRTAAAAQPRLGRMGTTLTVAYSIGNHLYVAHVGDTRCYLLRDGALHQITRDHTVHQELLAAGVAANDFEHQRYRHVLTNAIGGGVSKRAVVELQHLELRAGDIVMLSSDGLHEAVAAATIIDVLSRERRPANACAELIRAANAAGGRDNVTVVVARYGDDVGGA